MLASGLKTEAWRSPLCPKAAPIAMRLRPRRMTRSSIPRIRPKAVVDRDLRRILLPSHRPRLERRRRPAVIHLTTWFRHVGEKTAIF